MTGDGFAVIARDEFLGESAVLHKLTDSPYVAENEVRTPVSAFAFDANGRVVASSHISQPPAGI